MQLIIKNGHVIDPGNINSFADIYISEGKISKMDAGRPGGDATFDRARQRAGLGAKECPSPRSSLS